MERKQSKKMSFVESLANTSIGFITTLLVSPIIYWICNVPISFGQIGIATVLFTFVSILRGYIVRRFFNKL